MWTARAREKIRVLPLLGFLCHKLPLKWNESPKALMLTVSDLTYKIGARTILDECDVTIMDNWKVGVVGLNGAGKSTLFKLISGDLTPDGGTVEINAKQRMGMVRQDIPEVETSLLDLVLEAHEEMADLWRQTETEEDPMKIADIYQRLADLDAYSAPAKATRL